ncbi:hypothetical protein JMUB3935_2253 [Leptotrichia trevisanii]|uniref:Uncharacterized protein n=2 Tax=Leptotrichia trevisanii TaxID=109328 RepID=A0A510KNL0_9FUSO|nr:hypothetical protein [Leptotrichia trevisanii]BBM46057.1 hypothetical protein JMUB3870_2184 [Leptotrichia trevisanii]BBM53266.1 hypothetical protein JMUB3935_2253 [Leptotrichia trevisanii]
MEIDFNERDLLKEVLNFKIISRKYLEEKYGFKKLDYTIENVNNFLRENNNEIIHKSKNYLYYFGRYNEKVFKTEDRSINMKMSFRRELISLILLFKKEKLNIYQFNKQINRTQENTRNIQNDVKQILKNFNIKYSEYMKCGSIEKLFRERNYNLKEIGEEYLKEVLSKRLEKIYIGRTTYQENFYFKLLHKILEMKNIKYIKKILFSYIEEFTNIISLDERYAMLTYLISNIKNNDIKSRFNVKKNTENEEYFLMMEKIFKKERLEINLKFITMFYKKLHKKRESYKKIINEINNGLILNDSKNVKAVDLEMKNVQKINSQNKIQVYSIAESSVNFENENLLNKQIVKQYVQQDKVPKIPTLVLIDLEGKEILKNYNKIKKIFNFINIIKVEHLTEFKKIISKNNNDFEQVLLISSSKFSNVIKNFSYTPIYRFEIEKEKGALKNRVNFLKQMIYLRTMMLQYLEFKTNRRRFFRK